MLTKGKYLLNQMQAAKRSTLMRSAANPRMMAFRPTQQVMLPSMPAANFSSNNRNNSGNSNGFMYGSMFAAAGLAAATVLYMQQ